jgi:hypothetical protein
MPKETNVIVLKSQGVDREACGRLRLLPKASNSLHGGQSGKDNLNIL